MIIFDYIFYRITVFSLRHSEGEFSWVRGVCLVSLLQVFLILDFEVLLAVIRGGGVAVTSKFVFFLIMVAAYLFNRIRYLKIIPFEELNDRWQNESEAEKKKRKWLTILLFISVLSTPIIYGVLKHNLHWI